MLGRADPVVGDNRDCSSRPAALVLSVTTYGWTGLSTMSCCYLINICILYLCGHFHSLHDAPVQSDI